VFKIISSDAIKEMRYFLSGHKKLAMATKDEQKEHLEEILKLKN